MNYEVLKLILASGVKSALKQIAFNEKYPASVCLKDGA